MLGPLQKVVLCRLMLSWEKIILPEDRCLEEKGQYDVKEQRIKNDGMFRVRNKKNQTTTKMILLQS